VVALWNSTNPQNKFVKKPEMPLPETNTPELPVPEVNSPELMTPVTKMPASLTAAFC
jgi:hypothetical protein